MTRFEYFSAVRFRDLLHSVSSLVADATVEFNGGMSIRDFDPSHVAMVEFRLDKGHTGDNVTIGVNLPNLLKVLKRAKNGDSLSLEIGERVAVTFGDRTYTLQVEKPHKMANLSPNIPTATHILIGTRTLLERVEDTELVADNVTIAVEGSELSFGGKGENAECVSKVAMAKASGPAKGTYNVSYLLSILRNSLPFERVRLGLAIDNPIELTFPVAGGSLRFLLAPKQR